MAKAVVFDLDGTLADTVDLVGSNSRRKPADVLMTSESGARGRPWSFDDHRDLIPGNLAALGYRVAIVTASPPAYASTLADLLNIDFDRQRMPEQEAELEVVDGEMVHTRNPANDTAMY